MLFETLHLPIGYLSMRGFGSYSVIFVSLITVPLEGGLIRQTVVALHKDQIC